MCLRGIVKAGHAVYGIDAVGPGNGNEASRLLESAILKEDARTLYVVGNEGANTLDSCHLKRRWTRTSSKNSFSAP